MPSRSQTGNPWLVTNRVDPAVARMADDHYSRKTRGARQFAAPGRVLVLYIPGACWPFRADACWVWWDGIRADSFNGWWNNSLFRNEGCGWLSSRLIQDAVALVLERWGEPPLGFDTYVDTRKIASTNPGYCYEKAGWRRGDRNKTGKLLRWYFNAS